MKILVSFYSKTGRTKQIAGEICSVAKQKGHETVLHEIVPKSIPKKAKFPKDGKGIELVEPLLDLNAFDLVFVGSPVWGFTPCPIAIAYLRQLKNPAAKKFALFATCSVMPGKTLKKMANIVATAGASVVDSFSVGGLFDFDEKKLKSARDFAEKVIGSV